MRTTTLALARHAAASLLPLILLAPTVFAQSTDDDQCLADVGQEARRFTSSAFDALVDCANATVDGDACDATQLDALLDRFRERLARRIEKACRGVDLGGLGFACPAGDLDADSLAACLADGILDRLEGLLGVAYPDLAARAGDLGQCQRMIGKQAETFSQGKLRARVRCLERQLKGDIGDDVDCRAEVPPLGPGTGDPDTDQLIAKAMRRLSDKIRRACEDVDLSTLGFPGACGDATGGAFTLGDLQTCIRDRAEAVVDEIAALIIPAGGPQPTPVPSASATPVPSATATIGCVLPSPVPAILSLVAKPGVDLDTGWTGIAHDQRGVDNATLTAVRLNDCDLDPSSPTCGDCSIEGPIEFPGGRDNCFCLNTGARDASSLTACDPEMPSSCTQPETCECFYGPPLPLSSGAVPVCVVNLYAGTVSGTVNIAETVGAGAATVAGGARTNIELTSIVHNGLTVDQPCPICAGDPIANDGVTGGKCDAGPRVNMDCDVAGISPFFGPVSFQCPPPAAADVGSLTVRFTPATTGTTMLGTGPQCTAFGATALKCYCDTCATAAAEPCNSDADCPEGVACGGTRCIGGTANGTPCTAPEECPVSEVCDRPGEATRPNACSNGVCIPSPSDPDNPNEGRCQLSPNDNLCSIETFRGCVNSIDCNPPPAGNCGTCLPNQTCTTLRRACFLDPIERTGMPGTMMATLAATFCISPTRSPAVNAVAGLPGPAGLLVPVTIFRGSATCGNGVLDSGEQCDSPADDACPGGCQPDCTCGPFCGDNDVNQPGELCDGTDPGTCTAGCETDCTCTPVCGNGMAEGEEECDMGDDSACPGVCMGDCTCGPFCGDSTVDPGEECDGNGMGAECPTSACQSDCICGPFCGDGAIDPGEVCDSAAIGTCDGTCDVNCTCSPVCGNGVLEEGELCEPGAAETACPGECQQDCRCGPVFGFLSFVSRPGSDLDNGWTGQSHNGTIQAGAAIPGELAACDGVTDFECTFFANVGSSCSGDPSRSCTSTAQCLAGQTCVINVYGSPQPLSSGGVPVCLISRFIEDVTGTYNLQTGAASIGIPLNTLVFFSPNVSQPCPVCDCGKASLQDCVIGDTGMCAGFGSSTGNPCTVEATGPFGPTTNDCAPVPAANVSGGGVRAIYAPATTGMVSFATNQPCDAPGFEGQLCWCDGQARPNACNTACAAGDNVGMPCANDAACPNAPAGSCRPLCVQIAGEALGEGECPAGPGDRRCSLAEEIGCTSNANCPPGTGTCETGLRRCFLDPIEREGTAGTSQDVLASTLCIPATGSSAIDTNTGLPGPGALLLFNDILLSVCGNGTIDANEDCDPAGGMDAACPGQCDATTCQCPGAGVCGNGVVEPGEICEPPGVGCGSLQQCSGCTQCGS